MLTREHDHMLTRVYGLGFRVLTRARPQAYKGEVEKLGQSEKFLHTMAKIPKVREQIRGSINSVSR